MATAYTVFKGSASGHVMEARLRIPDLGPNDVLLENTHSGVCGTDLHYVQQDMVLGHEGIGIVKQIGPAVKAVKIGDRVGMGYARGGCGYCAPCQEGYTFQCENDSRAFGMADFDQGSMASHSVWPESRLVQIPASIPSEVAAPLMCAGQTVFVPFHRDNILPTETVGIMGIGGLGHLAIMIAAKWGCHVTVLSGTEQKKQEALSLGAHEFINTKEIGRIKPATKINRLFVTTSAKPDWNTIVNIMATHGHVYPLTIADGDFVFPYTPMILKELSIHGSCSSTMTQLRAMMDFVALHQIKPIVQEFPFNIEGVTAAFKRLEEGSIRYRGVLSIKS
ncbi:MAG: hypothetical protein Q9160_007511 [Pyrenula sp. 1 TL-2023]